MDVQATRQIVRDYQAMFKDAAIRNRQDASMSGVSGTGNASEVESDDHEASISSNSNVASWASTSSLNRAKSSSGKKAQKSLRQLITRLVLQQTSEAG